MRTVILCGGQGTRAWPATAEVPKPMLRIGDRPVLHHVMEIYADQGYTDFVLAVGWHADVIREWARTEAPRDWTIECLDSGIDADTGDRVRSCARHIGEPFLATYGDGLGDVEVAAVLGVHEAQAAAATVTTVPLPSQYGTLDTDDFGRVVAFREKPRLTDHWINAGFMVLDADALQATEGRSLERDVLPALGAQGRLYAYRHHGFWKSMDTHKDVLELNQLANQEGHPWLRRTT